MKNANYLLFVMILAGFFVAGIQLGMTVARREVADGIRSGRLSVNQRVEHIARQVERGPKQYVSIE